MRLNKVIYLWVVVGLASCAQTPNDVSLTVTQGQCVTAVYPGYESQATTYSQAFPSNGSLPPTSPYCVAVTLVNNNSGQYANNVQVYQSGLVVSYPVFGSTTYAASMVDFNAAGIPSSSFAAQQQLVDLNLFDPNNCVTTQGSKVTTLASNGGVCTFYLQLNGESLPVGVYPLTVSVNYTNGNAQYTTSTIINQRVNLYLGGNFTSNVAISNGASTVPIANSIISANSPESFGVTAMARDPFGVVYTGDIIGKVYKYTGTSINSWTEISGLPTGSPIAAMTTDSAANLYVVDNNGQVYQVTPSLTVNSMGAIPTESPSGIPNSAQVLGSTGSSATLLIAAGNEIYTCGLSTISVNSCLSTHYATGPNQIINQMLVSNTLTIASNLNVYQYAAGNTWVQIAGGLPGQNVDSIANYHNISNNIVTWYAGLAQLESTSSSVYFENNGAAFIPLISFQGGMISGNLITDLITDSAQGVFVSGTNLISSDFTNGQSVYVAYIPSTYFGLILAAPWTQITGISGGSVATLQTASQLTPY